ncbi:hypothetical protein [Thalassotalea sp. SU-HH00458]|uniref:hypothetical protein n=1 Tax=Thalassotalea sp. SU-HH00458 TaxID=3127657 RepID=UPI0033655DD3
MSHYKQENDLVTNAVAREIGLHLRVMIPFLNMANLADVKYAHKKASFHKCSGYYGWEKCEITD